MEYIVAGVYIAVSFLAAVAFVVAIGLTVSYSRSANTNILESIIYTIGISVIVTSLASGRNLHFVGESIEELYASPKSDLLNVGQRLINIIIFVAALGACIERFWHQHNKVRLLPGRRFWFVVLLVYGISNGVISSFFGTHPRFSPGLLYSLPVLCLLALDERLNRVQLCQAIRNVCMLVIISGFICLAVRPDIVIERGFRSLLGLLPFRYWGATAHANALGGLSVLAILMLYYVPYKRRLLNALMVVISIISLFAAQSKTAYAAFVAVSLSIYGFHLFKSARNARQSRQFPFATTLGFVMLALGALVLLMLISYRFDELAGAIGTGRDINEVATLSGRTKIWAAALREWRDNPIFGYGPDLFDVEHRVRLRMLFAFHAHNQFVQTLAQSGLVGVAGLLLLLLAGSYASVKAISVTNGVSMALFILIIIRGITEVPLRSGGIISPEFLTVIAWLVLLMPSRIEEQVKYLDTRLAAQLSIRP